MAGSRCKYLLVVRYKMRNLQRWKQLKLPHLCSRKGGPATHMSTVYLTLFDMLDYPYYLHLLFRDQIFIWNHLH